MAVACLLGEEWVECELVAVRPHNHDTALFDFALPAGVDDPGAPLGLPPCSSLLMLAPGREHGGGDAVRPYTPVSAPWTPGRFTLLVKRYREWGVKWVAGAGRPNTLHSYRPAGAVSNYVHELSPGDAVLFCHRAATNRKIQYPSQFGDVRRINMIAVGAGVAPMVQALHMLLNTPGDDRQIVLLYGNRTVADILMREQLEAWAKEHSHRFKLVHCIGSRWANIHMGVKTKDYKPPPLPDGFEELRAAGPGEVELGWADEAKIVKHGFPPAPDTRVFVCGLPGVYDIMCGPRTTPEVLEGTCLHRLGYGREHVVKF